MPTPETVHSSRLGSTRSLLLLLLSAISGVAIGFMAENLFKGWKLQTARFGCAFLAAGICFCAEYTCRRLIPGSQLDLSRVTQSPIPAWRHPAIWSFSLFLACSAIGTVLHVNRLAIAQALRWGAFEFVGLYAVMVVGYWAYA